LRDGPGVSHSTLTDAPLPDGTKVRVHEANGQWRFVTTINAKGEEDLSGWVHGNWLFDL
jgi:N-acetylmuramoyl-L-alanine amidase